MLENKAFSNGKPGIILLSKFQKSILFIWKCEKYDKIIVLKSKIFFIK